MRVFNYTALALFVFFTLSAYGCKSMGSAVDVQAVKVAPQQDANAVKVQADEISAIKESLNSFEKMFESISAKMAVVDKSNQQRVEGDGNVVNDSELMKTIFKYQYWIFSAIFAGLFMVMKLHARARIKQYEWQIKRLMLEKEDYKQNFLARAIKDENELREFRIHHEEMKKKIL